MKIELEQEIICDCQRQVATTKNPQAKKTNTLAHILGEQSQVLKNRKSTG